MIWFVRVFGRSFVWKLGALAAVVVVGAFKACYAQTIDCASACTVTVVHEFSLPPFQLDTADGAQIAGAILAVWALGFGFRAIIRALHIDGKPNSESDL